MPSDFSNDKSNGSRILTDATQIGIEVTVPSDKSLNPKGFSFSMFHKRRSKYCLFSGTFLGFCDFEIVSLLAAPVSFGQKVANVTCDGQ
jgi:hypothetical protein